jgi:cellulose synthase/poly-beta-1,6-N-acetylglucosamine synthase-like glycosyltransferase
LHLLYADYALGMELKKRGYKATYLMQYLAEGEAPDEARNVFQQRSRWTKGHYQVWDSLAAAHYL